MKLPCKSRHDECDVRFLPGLRYSLTSVLLQARPRLRQLETLPERAGKYITTRPHNGALCWTTGVFGGTRKLCVVPFTFLFVVIVAIEVEHLQMSH